jgi:hypothetical protein
VKPPITSEENAMKSPEALPPSSTPSVEPLSDDQQKLEETRREVAWLTVAGLRDNLSPQDRALVRNLERSARAELKLRRLALSAAPEAPNPEPATSPSPQPLPTTSIRLGISGSTISEPPKT